MNDLNLYLQIEDVPFCIQYDCRCFAMPGITSPAQISIIAREASVINEAYALHLEIRRRLVGKRTVCRRPCRMRLPERGCRHVLVLMIGSGQQNDYFESLANAWLRGDGGDAMVLPVLCGGGSHTNIFSGEAHPVLSRCNRLIWGNSPSRIAEIVMASALIDRKPGVFLSYLRKEASAGAEQIHDALTHAGFRVFLDRFSGTPGRLFPQELAEAMADMGLVVLLETASLRQSRWTMWEAAFARRYRIGPIAVNFNGADELHLASRRLTLPDDPAQPLPVATVDRIIEHIRQEYLNVAFARQAYYETLIRLAANSKGGQVQAVGAGVLEIEDKANVSKGFALPSGAPGQLKHVRRLVDMSGGSKQIAGVGKRLLAGEHQHLPPSDRGDLNWLSDEYQVTLAGSASVYRAVRALW